MIDGVLQLELGAASWAGGSTATGAFVVGEENRVLLAPLSRLLDESDKTAPATKASAPAFNPLVLVGPSLSGKSHLVQGVVRRRDAATSRYFTAADFTREHHAARVEERLASWRGELRELDVLVVEDLQHIRPPGAAQWELRETIDALIGRGAQVVVTADREPAAIKSLETGLRDRLQVGLTLRIARPELPARRQILLLAAQSRGMSLSEESLADLARRQVGAAGQLIGELLRHEHRSRAKELRGGQDNQNQDHEIQGEYASGHALEPSFRHILAATARYFDVPQKALLGPSRQSSLVRARNVAVRLARQLTRMSYAEIGRSLGGRDHTTIMHAADRAVQQAASDPLMQQALDDLGRLLG